MTLEYKTYFKNIFYFPTLNNPTPRIKLNFAATIYQAECAAQLEHRQPV